MKLEPAKVKTTKKPPQPAPICCEVCGAQLPFKERLADRDPGIIASLPTLYWAPNYEGHEDCLEELRKRQAVLANEEAERRRAKDLEKQTGLPAARVQACTFEAADVDDHNAAAHKALSTWDVTSKRGIMLVGMTGTGKTYLLFALINRLYSLGIYARFVTLKQMLEHLGACMHDREDFAFELQKLRTRRVLIIDDIGAEKLTEWKQEQFLDVLDYRYAHELPTFFSSNLKPREGLSQWYSDRVWSRIVGLVNKTAIEVKGGDRRRTKA